MKFYHLFSLLFCFVLSSCNELEENLDVITESGITYSPIDVSAGDVVSIDGTDFQIFKIPVYDAENGDLYDVTLPSQMPFESFEVTLEPSERLAIGYDKDQIMRVVIDGHDAFIVTECDYTITRTVQAYSCSCSVHIQIGSLLLTFAMSSDDVYQIIDMTDHDFTDEDLHDFYQQFSDGSVDDLIDFIHINAVML